MIDELTTDAISLLKELIAIPSFSREEHYTAGAICRFLAQHKLESFREDNNVYAFNRHFNYQLPTILLNSHHDTVRPNESYSRDPFDPTEENGRIFGLGSNDAGGALVSLLAAFINFHDRSNLKYNLVFAATAEEEISGEKGIESLFKRSSFLDRFKQEGSCAIVGEPTLMQMAVAERGLMVLDCKAKGKAGHAARNEGENSIYNALNDIVWFRDFQFPRTSKLLGAVKMTTTVIHTPNQAHNVVPDCCHFVVDTRVNEYYTFDEILDQIRKSVRCEVKPRSTRLKSSLIPADHPLVRAGVALGLSSYGSPTTSDKALIPVPALKIGPGDSARSHIADEFIYSEEIRQGISLYINLLEKCLL